jgi:hypothetical protein
MVGCRDRSEAPSMAGSPPAAEADPDAEAGAEDAAWVELAEPVDCAEGELCDEELHEGSSATQASATSAAACRGRGWTEREGVKEVITSMIWSQTRNGQLPRPSAWCGSYPV